MQNRLPFLTLVDKEDPLLWKFGFSSTQPTRNLTSKFKGSKAFLIVYLRKLSKISFDRLVWTYRIFTHCACEYPSNSRPFVLSGRHAIGCNNWKHPCYYPNMQYLPDSKFPHTSKQIIYCRTLINPLYTPEMFASCICPTATDRQLISSDTNSSCTSY